MPSSKHPFPDDNMKLNEDVPPSDIHLAIPSDVLELFILENQSETSNSVLSPPQYTGDLPIPSDVLELFIAENEEASAIYHTLVEEPSMDWHDFMYQPSHQADDGYSSLARLDAEEYGIDNQGNDLDLCENDDSKSNYLYDHTDNDEQLDDRNAVLDDAAYAKYNSR